MEEATEKNYYEILGLDRYDLMLLDEADVSFTVRARLRELIIDLPNGDTVEEMQTNRALEKEYERIADILCDPTARTRYDCEIVTEMARNKTLPVIEPKEKSKVIPGLADADLNEVDETVDRILVQREANGVGAAGVSELVLNLSGVYNICGGAVFVRQLDQILTSLADVGFEEEEGDL